MSTVQPTINPDELHMWRGDLAMIDHAVVRVPDLAVGLDWYRRVFGLVECSRVDGRAYLACPTSGHVILGLTEGGTGLEYISYLAYDAQSLDRVRQRLTAGGIACADCKGLSRPGAIEAIRVTLPNGHALEVLHAERGKPAPTADYRPGLFDVRSSHLQFRTIDVREMAEFLQVLGFKRSSYVQIPDGSDKLYIQFMRINDRHHQLAILTGPAGLHHVAVELDDTDFWKFCDHLAKEHIPAEYGPGRHLEGNMMFIYVRDPFGNRTEITSTMEVVGHDYPTMPCSEDPPAYHMNMWGPQPPHSWETEWN